MYKLIGIAVLTLAASGAANAFGLPPIFHLPPLPHGPPTMAPEIDPASAMGGLTLLIGGLAVIRGRRASK